MAHAAPLAVAIALYFAHARFLMSGQLAANALRGWLLPYMPSSLGDVWLAFLGFVAMNLGPWLAAPFTLVFLASLAWAVQKRARTVAVIGVTALAIAIALALSGQYPFGPTRHATWMVPFVVLPVAWVVAEASSSRRPTLRVLAPVAGLLLLFGGPLGRTLGVEAVEQPQPERTLLVDDLGRMLEVLASSPGTEPLLLNGQTYFLLIPLFEEAGARAERVVEGFFSSLNWLGRPVIVSDAWDLRVRLSELRTANHLHDLVSRVDEASPELALGGRREALILFGGWPPAMSGGDLGALLDYGSVVRTGWAVPGLQLFVTDLAEFERIVSEAAGT